MKRVAVILVALAAGVICADSTDPGFTLGYQFLPDLPVGVTLSTYDALWGLGMEGTLSAGGSRSHGQSTDRFSLSLGLNTPTPIDDLYSSLAISASHTRTEQGAHTIVDAVLVAPAEMRTDWGVDAKLTAFAYSLVGMTVGFRAPFRDPLGGSVILGLSIALQYPAPRQG